MWKVLMVRIKILRLLARLFKRPIVVVKQRRRRKEQEIGGIMNELQYMPPDFFDYLSYVLDIPLPESKCWDIEEE